MLLNPEAATAENNDWRASYTDFSGTPRTTTPDFLLEGDREVIECKPLRLHESPLVRLKADAVRALAKKKGWTFRLEDPGIPSSETLTLLEDSGRVVFTEKTKERISKWLYT